MFTKRFLTPILILPLFTAWPLRAQEVSYIYPLGGQRGAVVTAEVGGALLDHPDTAVWFSSGPQVFALEPDSPGSAGRAPRLSKSSTGLIGQILLSGDDSTAVLQLSISPDTPVGAHSFRFLTPRGLSNAISFWVIEDDVVAETDAAHDTPGAAQPVPFPAVISGRASEPNQLDYYAIEVGAGEELTFRVQSAGAGFDPQLELLEPGGSWFDPDELTLLKFNDEPVSPHLSRDPHFTYRFDRAGRYLLRIGSMENSEGFKDGGPSFMYLLRITRSDSPGPPVSYALGQWKRHLGPNHLKQLWARTVETPNSRQPAEEEADPASSGEGIPEADANKAAPVEPAPEAPVELPVVQELDGHNGAAEQAQEVALPVIIEGTIDHPDDVDFYKFNVKAGEGMAFEIETPKKGPPLFNPRMGVFDENGDEVLTNIYKRLVRNFTFYAKDLMPKTIYTFKLDGQYFLEIRDITSRMGEPDFKYRLLIRRQVPHMGGISVAVDRVNLRPGEAQKLAVTTRQEEGYSGEIAIAIENLPPGVHAVTGAEVEPDKAPHPDEGLKDQFMPKTQEVTIMLLADEDAPLTPFPQTFRMTFRSVVEGKPGPALPARDVLIMVIRPEAEPQP